MEGMVHMSRRTWLTLTGLGVLALGSMGFGFAEPSVCVDLLIDINGDGVDESLCLPPS